MARFDPRFTGVDAIRIFEKNLTLADKRLVIAFFFSLIPVKEPKVDALQILLDFLSLIPIAGRFADLFQISVATAQAAKDIAELFGFEFEEEDVELERLRFELQTLTEEFRLQREDLRLALIEADRQRERANALLGTVELLEDEIRRLEASRPPEIDPNLLRSAIRGYFSEVDRLFRPTGNELVQQRNQVRAAFQQSFGEEL